MNWTPIRAGLVGLAQFSGIAPPAIAWEGSPGANELVVGARLLMAIGTVRGIGEDIEARIDNAGGADQTVAVQGNREFTWLARFESMSSSPPTDALTYAENLRARLGRSTAVATARASNLAIVGIGDTTRIPYVVEGRQVSCYQVTVTVATTEDDVDATTGAGQFVNAVNYDGTVSDGAADQDVPGSVGPVT